MKREPHQPEPAIEGMGKAVGGIVGFFLTMPTFRATQDAFHASISPNAHPEYLWFWDWVFIACIFIAFVMMTWGVIALCWGITKSVCRGFFTTLRSISAFIIAILSR